MCRESKMMDNFSLLMLLSDVLTRVNASPSDSLMSTNQLKEGLEAIEQVGIEFVDEMERETGNSCAVGDRLYSILGVPINNTKQIGIFVSRVAKSDSLLPSPELQHWRVCGDSAVIQLQPLFVELLAIWVLQLRARCQDEGSLDVPLWPNAPE